MADPFHPYAEQHKSPKGAGDARPTALQIVKDNDLVGKWTDKVVLITGATSGIGVETLRAIHSTGAHCFITARDASKAASTIKEIVSTSPSSSPITPLTMDLSSLSSVRTGAADFLSQSSKLHILINNAGIMACPETRTPEGNELQFATNHLSHFLLFSLLRPTLLQSSTPQFHSRVIDLASSGHRTSSTHLDNPSLEGGIYTPWLAYGQAKTANIHMANQIERLYGAQGLHGLSVHPGGIWTPLQKHLPKEQVEAWQADPKTAEIIKSVEQGAATTVWAAVGKVWEGKGGKFLEDCGVAEPADMGDPNLAKTGYAPWAYDEEAEKGLWELSERLVGASSS